MGLDLSGPFRYPPPAPAWLARRVEDVIEPDLPIIDPHHHLWEEGAHPYLLDEILEDAASGHRVVATVCVQAYYGYRTSGPPELAPVGETEKVAAIARAAIARGARTKIAAAIVAFADLTMGRDVARVLDAHEVAGGGTLRGIRHSVARDPHYPQGLVSRPPPAHMLADAQYRAGLATLVPRGLSFDAMIYHHQIPELTAMARALPDLPVILDHIGCVLGVGPYEKTTGETFRTWRADMAALAQCPNATVKIGGFGMIITGARWHERANPPASSELAEAWRPYVESCIELFGADRCMFESNFPVDKAMYSYRTMWNAFKRLTSGASASEKAALFAGTAARAYKIPVA